MKKRKKRLPALIAVLIAVVTIFVIIPSNQPSDCFIWKVEINKSVFYLAGSIHAASEENYPLPKTYLKNYKKADKVIFELEEDFETIEKKLFQYAEKDILSERQYLNHHLSPKCVGKLKQLFNEKNLERYFQHEAWLLNMGIAGKKSKLIGYDPLLAVDKYFHDLAKADKKAIIGLDSLQTQIKLFEFEVPFEIQIKIIEKAVAGMEMQTKNEAPLYLAYFSNNLKSFESEFLKPYNFDKPQMKQIYDKVFSKRNTSWVKSFEELSIKKPGTFFVLVGAGHYFGPNNIRELLEKKGYRIEKI